MPISLLLLTLVIGFALWFNRGGDDRTLVVVIVVVLAAFLLLGSGWAPWYSHRLLWLP